MTPASQALVTVRLRKIGAWLAQAVEWSIGVEGVKAKIGDEETKQENREPTSRNAHYQE